MSVEKKSNDKIWWLNCSLLIIGIAIIFILGYLKKIAEIEEKVKISLALIVVGLFLGWKFLSLKFDVNENFENKCKNLGCEFLIFYSKEKSLKNKYDKLLPILESYKLSYYALLLSIYIGVGSLIVFDNKLRSEFNKDKFLLLYLTIVVIWILSKFFIHKILLIEKVLGYESTFSKEFFPYLSEYILDILVIILGVIKVFKMGESLGNNGCLNALYKYIFR